MEPVAMGVCNPSQWRNRPRFSRGSQRQLRYGWLNHPQNVKEHEKPNSFRQRTQASKQPPCRKVRWALVLNPLHGFLRQSIKRFHAQFQMLLARVLDFIVADAV